MSAILAQVRRDRQLWALAPCRHGPRRHLLSGRQLWGLKLREAEGIKRYQGDNQGRWVTREQRKATVNGADNGRFYDGLARKPDGTYEDLRTCVGANVTIQAAPSSRPSPTLGACVGEAAALRVNDVNIEGRRSRKSRRIPGDQRRGQGEGVADLARPRRH